jgi:hypothetical protein
MTAGFGAVSRVLSVKPDYMDPASKQVSVAGSYMPPVEMLKALLTGQSNFAACACGFMLLLLLQSGFPGVVPDIALMLQDLWPGHAVWEEFKPGVERQVSTPAFIKRLLADTDAAFILSAMFTGAWLPEKA